MHATAETQLKAADLSTEAGKEKLADESIDIADEEENDENQMNPAATTASTAAKKKKRKKKKAATTSASLPDPSAATAAIDASNSKPPSIPVSKQFPGGQYPAGEMQDYADNNLWRTTSEEKRAIERAQYATIANELRQGAEVHRQVRQYAKRIMKPGMSMIDICEAIENGTRTLIEENGLQAGNMNHI